MSISTFTSYRTKQDAPWQTITFTKNALTTGTNNVTATQWYTAPDASTTSPTSAACDSATDGADHLALKNASSTMRIGRLSIGNGFAAHNTWILVDRLSCKFGLAGNTFAAQTVNTTALTRYTDGVGVCALLEISQQVGTSATTYTLSFTGVVGGASSTSIAQAVGATARRNAGFVAWSPLPAGETGVLSVQSVTLAATTGVAGEFGIVLVKPLLMVPVHYTGQAIHVDPLLVAGVLPQIQDSACLQWICLAGSASNTTGTLNAELTIIAE